MTSRIRLFREPLTCLVVVAALMAYGLVRGDYVAYVLTLAALYATVAVGLDLVLGYSGYISLAHGALFGVGAYAYALLTMEGNWSFWPALVASGVITGGVALAVGLPALRTSGLYFAVLTLGIGIVFVSVALSWTGLTGGSHGLVGIPGPKGSLGQLDLVSTTGRMVIALVVFAVTYLACVAFVRSRHGRSSKAIRGDALLAKSFGIRVERTRLLVFGFSGIWAGAAGATYAALVGFISPTDFAVLGIGFELVVFVVVGGQGTLWGPAAGALVLTAFPQVFRIDDRYTDLLFGLFLLVVIVFARDGLAGILRRVSTEVTRRRPVARREVITS